MLSFQTPHRHVTPSPAASSPMILPKGFGASARPHRPESSPGFDKEKEGTGDGLKTPATENTGSDVIVGVEKDDGQRSRSHSSDSISGSVSCDSRKQYASRKRRMENDAEEQEEECDDDEEQEQEDGESSSHRSRKLNRLGNKDEDEEDDDDDAGDSDCCGEVQREILTQKPLGLLAHHGLSGRSTSGSARFRRKEDPDDDVDDDERRRRQRQNGGINRRDVRAVDVGCADKAEGDEDGQKERPTSRGSRVDDFHKATSGLRRMSHYVSPILGVLPGNDVSGRGCPDYMSLMDQRFMPSPPLSASPEPGQCLSTPGHNWTFEEQFKQLYDLSNDPNRKLFLDDLFSFMQKRGTPVNRIPIMAKQTLDLFELFQLVVSKGGLVEVINKKLWREITKGLNLPSSITSAAFTLRTQYMKYLYPYECEKLKLSTLNELQYAVDGNRREGRRSGFGQEFSPIPPILPLTPAAVSRMHEGLPSRVVNPGEPSPASFSLKDRDHLLLPPAISQLRTLAECDAQTAKAAATQAMAEVTKRMEEATRAAAVAPSIPIPLAIPGPGPPGPCLESRLPGSISSSENLGLKATETLSRRLSLEDTMRLPSILHRATGAGVSTAHIKLSSQGNGHTNHLGNSIIGSMEINGILYQGVLFAQPTPTNVIE